MADAARAHDDLDVERLARRDGRRASSPSTTARRSPRLHREEVDRQDLVLQELSDLLLRVLVAGG